MSTHQAAKLDQFRASLRVPFKISNERLAHETVELRFAVVGFRIFECVGISIHSRMICSSRGPAVIANRPGTVVAALFASQTHLSRSVALVGTTYVKLFSRLFVAIDVQAPFPTHELQRRRNVSRWDEPMSRAQRVFKRPALGSDDTPYLRLLRATYSDGTVRVFVPVCKPEFDPVAWNAGTCALIDDDDVDGTAIVQIPQAASFQMLHIRPSVLGSHEPHAGQLAILAPCPIGDLGHKCA
jgi:hypothetical protein